MSIKIEAKIKKKIKKFKFLEKKQISKLKMKKISNEKKNIEKELKL